MTRSFRINNGADVVGQAQGIVDAVSFFAWPAPSEFTVWDADRVYKMFPRLGELRRHMGNELSGGEQQMLSVERTLMGNPQRVLVDEPTEGLAPILVKAVIKMLVDIQQSGVTILLVEQNLKAAIGVVSRFYIMSKGTIVFKGDRESLEKADEVKRKYLEV